MSGERGEKGGVVLDGPDEDVDADQTPGGKDDAALAPIEEADKVIAEPSGDTDPKRGAEDPEVGGDGEGEEGELPAEGKDTGSPDESPIIALKKELEELRAKVNTPPAEKPKEYTEEEWAKMEQDWGVPRTAIQQMTGQSVKVVNHLTSYIDAKLAKLEFSQTLEDFSKETGFSDAARYRKEVTEFMGAYEPKHWSNPELLKRAVFYARGVNADKNMSRARNDSERNRQIAGRARPSSPNGGQRRVGAPPLNETQRAAAELMDGGVNEYNKFRRNGGRVVLEA